MALQQSRYAAPAPASVSEGWRLERMTPPSRLFGANGIRTGADGRIYVAQVSGSQISAINVDTGEVETVSPMGSEIVAPDDIVFDDEGNLYATEITEGRVSMRAPNGATRVVWGDIPVANPITFHQGRLIAGELRMGGRILELDRNGGAPRVIFEGVPMANAFEVGPDGKLYFPAQAANEIWRVGLDGGEPEVVAKDLGVPDSVKFDSQGRIVSTQVHSGQVLRIDPRTGAKEVLADLSPGLDNVAFVGERIFISSIPGYVYEITSPGQVKPVIPGGFNWPLGLAVVDGVVFAADGPFTYWVRPGAPLDIAGMLFTPGSPGYCRGAAASGAAGEVIVTTANGQVARWRPAEQASEVLADGFDQLMGVAVGPDGAVVFADWGTGRVHSVKGGKVEVLAERLDRPMGVAIGGDGTVYVTESGAGRVVKLAGGRTETVLDDLKAPQGLLILDGRLYVLDAGLKALVESDLSGGGRRTLASQLPVGPPAGVVPKYLKAIPPLSGPMGPFAGLAAGPDGTIYLSADAEGSVLALKPAR